MKKLKRPDAPRLRADPTEDAWEALKDAENIGRDTRRRLRSYTDEDEITQNNVHVHVHQESRPDIDVEASIELGPLKAKNLPKWATAAIVGVGLVAAVATAVASYLAARGSH